VLAGTTGQAKGNQNEGYNNRSFHFFYQLSIYCIQKSE